MLNYNVNCEPKEGVGGKGTQQSCCVHIERSSRDNKERIHDAINQTSTHTLVSKSNQLKPMTHLTKNYCPKHTLK